MSATCDEAIIRRWFTKWPDANIGIATGPASGYWVLDSDDRHGGAESLRALEATYGPLPHTITVDTGGGGQHRLFACPADRAPIRNRIKILPGIDVRGEGGYAVAPPSLHASGARYDWSPDSGPDDVPIAVAPDWLVDLVRGSSAAPGRVSCVAGPELLARARAYVEKVGPQSEGTRNTTAFKLAGHLRALVGTQGERLSEDEIHSIVQEWNDRCSPPLDPRELARCVASSRLNGTPPPDKPSDSFGSASGKHTPDSWPDPQPLPDQLRPVSAFDPWLLPKKFRAWIEDIAERMQCPIDFPAVAAMVALAAIVGRKVGIRPKLHDVWLVIANLWGAVIGRPGILKTPSIQEPIKPLRRLEVEAKNEFEARVKEHEALEFVAKQRRKLGEGVVLKLLRAGEDALEEATKALVDETEKPTRRRYIVNDSTVEKLGELLNENPNGLLVYRDELIGLLKSLDKEGQEGARSFYLEAWNGDGRYTYDRIARGTVDIEAAIVSIIGGIQPGPLSGYLAKAIEAGQGDDGLLQRFQLAVWPDVSRDWINVDRWPDTAAKNEAYAVFTNLDRATAESLGAVHDADDPDAIPYLQFSPSAQEVFDAWRAELERVVRSGDEHPAIESHLAKFRSLVPALALLIHLADGATGPVELDALQRAIGWAAYLETHARRIYSVALHPDVAAAKALAGRIRSGKVKSGFTQRDVYRANATGLTSPDEVARAVKVLIELDWIREARNDKTGGAPRTSYQINPKLLGSVEGSTDSTDTSEPIPPSDGGARDADGEWMDV